MGAKNLRAGADLVVVQFMFSNNWEMGTFGLETFLVSNVVDSVHMSVFLVFVGEGSVHNQSSVFLIQVFQFSESVMLGAIAGFHAKFETLRQNFGILTDDFYLAGVSEGNSEQSDEYDDEFHFGFVRLGLL